MKKENLSIVFIALIVAIASCSGRFYNHIITYDDEFRNSSKTIVRVSVRSEENRTEVNTAKIVFEKGRQGSAGEFISKAYFVISRSSASFSIESEAYLKAGGQKFGLRVVEPISEYKTEYETSEMSTESSDSTGYNSFQMSDTNSSQWFDEKFVIELTPEMVTAIGSTDEMVFRFYFGPVQATFKLNGKKLNVVKGVFKE
jgi:hypothetical protein